MTLLIVDDDCTMTELLSRTINWKELEIDRVLCALSASAARAVFMNEPVDIMICDIEMPGESGIDLLSWVREQGFDTINIFLTNHQKFSYVQTAIKLDTLDFIGKMSPQSELTDAVKKAVHILRTKQLQKRYLEYGHYWEENSALLWRQFWEDLISEKIPPNRETIDRVARDRLMEWYGADSSCMEACDTYLPVLITVLLAQDALEDFSAQELDFCVYNIVSEVLYGTTNSDHVLSLGRENGRAVYAVVLDQKDVPGFDRKAEELADLFQQYLHFSVSLYYGSPVPLEKISETVRLLRAVDLENVLQRSGVHHIAPEQKSQEDADRAPGFPMEKLSGFLAAGQSFQAVTLVKDYFSSLPRAQISAALLQKFRFDYNQTLYALLAERHISAHLLFSQPGADALSRRATDSLISMLKWVSFSAGAVVSVLSRSARSNTVVDTVKAYIGENYAQRLTKADIAAQVFLNPDYLAKLFKKETGTALTDYLTQVRIEKAKALLRDGTISLTDVATQTGFDYYSYFSTIFKKATGVSPSDYRKNASGE